MWRTKRHGERGSGDHCQKKKKTSVKLQFAPVNNLPEATVVFKYDQMGYGEPRVLYTGETGKWGVVLWLVYAVTWFQEASILVNPKLPTLAFIHNNIIITFWLTVGFGSFFLCLVFTFEIILRLLWGRNNCVSEDYSSWNISWLAAPSFVLVPQTAAAASSDV